MDGLADIRADIIALQEVALPQNNAAWLAEQLNQRGLGEGHYTHYLCPKTGPNPNEGIAFLSRLPVKDHATLDLGSQNRVAQHIIVEAGAQAMVCVNVHLFWFPGKSRERLQQVDILLRWVDDISGDTSIVLCGDFNSPPESPTIQKVEQRFVSAYKARHGREPKYTVPTRLPVSKLFQAGTLLRFFLAQWRQLRNIDPTWQGTLDYIFIDNQAKVEECELILTQPAPGDPKLYPSDHIGLCADINLGDPRGNRKKTL